MKLKRLVEKIAVLTLLGVNRYWVQDENGFLEL
jgi:hypothetical protein